MAYIIIKAIYWFADIITFVLLVRVLFSWLQISPYSTLGKINQFVIRFTEPFVAPCRALLSRFNTGMFDFSVLLAFFLIQFVSNILIRLVGFFI